ncbi:unnamed protein product [Peronospora belbahrii]|uniref:SH3 domain-containing protein n=1 Tax=Peronospora belbahrii TaxID=622444 RepID=A0ABN8CMU3_9STRA|nr:unnamed protein product [Peronospora belbahrii]
MRWYCVHPSLPVQAELRIRSAPDSNAFEMCRISQVMYLDKTSGEMEKGYIMTSLPDGLPLVSPWETTYYRGCCEVMDPVTLMFDGPQDAARSLGTVQSVDFLYCIMEESKTRLRIFHPEMESVWIDKDDLQVVCTRLEHEECSTSHAFYEINDELPEEAQIAVRDFPSKQAQVVGLLSRNETLEVTIRSGNWLQIVGGSLNKAWIMFRTDALELLREARDVCSSNCEMDGDLDDSGNIESTSNQASCADTAMVTLPVTSNTTAFTVVPNADYKNTTAPEADDVAKISSGDATITVDGFPNASANVGTVKRLPDCADCQLRSVQLVAVDDDTSGDIAGIRTENTDDVGDTSVTRSAVITNVEVVELTPVFQTSVDPHLHSVQIAHDVADAEVIDGLADADVIGFPADANIIGGLAVADVIDDLAGDAAGVHLDDTNVENERASYLRCTRSIQSVRTKLNEIEHDDNYVASDGINATSCKTNDVEGTENGEPAQYVYSQGGYTLSSFDPIDAITEVITNTVPLQAKLIVSDTTDSKNVGAAEAGFLWDDRPIRPARIMLACNSCSASSGKVAESETRDIIFESDLQSLGDSRQIAAKLEDTIGTIGDATAVNSPDDVTNEIVAEITKPVRSVELRDNCRNLPTALDWSDTQVDGDMNTCNGDVSIVTVISPVDKRANGNQFEFQGDQLNEPARDQPDDQSANGSTNDYTDEVGAATRLSAKGSAEVVHVKQPGSDQPAQTVFDKVVSNDAADTPAVIAEFAIAHTDDGIKACVNICVANPERDTAKPSQFAQTWGDESVRSPSTILSKADDESDKSEYGNLRFRSANDVRDETDFNDGIYALAIEEEAKIKGMEPIQLWDKRPIWPEQSIPDAPPADSTTLQKRIGIAVADADAADKLSGNSDDEDVVKVVNDRPNQPSLKDCLTPGRANIAADSAGSLVASKNASNRAAADETDFKNARLTLMEVEAAKQVQTARLHDYPSALNDSAIVISGAGIGTVQDKHTSHSMACFSTTESHYAEMGSTSGSESGEIALLGDLEDVFEPVDEWLSAKQEEGDEDGDNSLSDLPALRKDTSLSQSNVVNGEQGEQSDSSRISHSACYCAEDTTETVPPAGISFLQKFGIRKYCERSKTHFASMDMLSLAIHDANQDNSDVIFQALVGDDSLSDDWFFDVIAHQFQAYTHSASKNFNLVTTGPKLTFDLIMNDARPEDILAAELSDDDGADFDLVVSFKYPVPTRRADGLPFGRVPSERVAGTKSKCAGAINGSGVETKGAPSASFIHIQEADISAATSLKTALSKSCISQPKMLTPSSRLQRSSMLAPVTTKLEALTSSSAATTTSSTSPSVRSFFQRQRFISAPSSSKVPTAAGLTRNCVTDSTKSPSGLSAPRKSFGFRYPSGLIKKT